MLAASTSTSVLQCAALVGRDETLMLQPPQELDPDHFSLLKNPLR